MTHRAHLALAAAALLAANGPHGHAQIVYFEPAKAILPTTTGSYVGSSISSAGPSILALAWQEIRPRSPTSGDIFLSVAVTTDGSSWTTTQRITDPVGYEGVTAGYEPRVYSMVVDSANRILVAVAPSDKQVILLESADAGLHFTRRGEISSTASIGAPLLFASESGGYVLLVSQGSPADAAAGRGEVTIAYSHSQDGANWSPLAPFVADADSLPAPRLLPAHAGFQGRDFVVFEALKGDPPISQIYLKTSSDGGSTWDRARPLTLASPAFGDHPADFNNERPRLAALPTGLVLSWERTRAGDSKTVIMSARLDSGGSVIGLPQVESAGTPSRFSTVVRLRGKDYVLYSDGSGQHENGTQAWTIELGERGVPAARQPLANVDRQLDALFPQAVVFRDALYAFWESSPPKPSGSMAVVRLPPVTSVGPPTVTAVDFSPGQFINRDSATVRWSEPQPADAAGIRTYTYSWLYSDGTATREIDKPTVVKPSDPKLLISTRKLDKDGVWTFSITATDNAGNVTRTPATISLTRKATPPRPVGFEVIGDGGTVLLDAPFAPPDNRDVHSHVLPTNTFTLRWVSPGETDIAGYTYNIQPGWRTLDDYRKSPVPLVLPPERVVTTSTDVPFMDSDNGVYAVTVRAVDKAGNFSAPSTIALGLLSYKVVTRVDSVTARKDPVYGTVSVTINGRGFIENGPIRKIYLERANSSRIEIDPASVTVTDRRISGIELDQNRDSGSYRVGFLQDRPNGQPAIYFPPVAPIVFESPGWVITGNIPLLFPPWIAGRSATYFVSSETLVIVLILALLGTLAFLAIRRIGALAVEGAAVNAQVVALLEGRPNLDWLERKKRMLELKRKGIGLRLKFTLLMVVLVILIVLIVSVPLGVIMVNRQQESLTTGLQSSANILLGALASGATSQFKQEIQGLSGIRDILSLRATMREATYTTITGRSFTDAEMRSINQSPAVSGPNDGRDYVWASDQKKFADEYTAGDFKITQEQPNDELAKLIPVLQKKMEEDLAARLGPDINAYRTLRGRFKDAQARTDAKSAEDLRVQMVVKRQEIDAAAQDIYGKASTTEPLTPNRLRPTYIFYRPVVFYNAAENLADTAFFQGMVRVEVRTDEIGRRISDVYGAIFRIAGLIAVIAIALGILGAIIMASITVTPIRRLARGVAVIRDTEDKEQLKDHSIEVGTRDEIGQLAETVNEMTQGLVKAAIANKALLAGIDVQKRFLPLVKNAAGGETSTTQEENARLEIFGYYKGAAGVSGDYFDFRRLDDTYYALIKCDVSGKGVSAALIMVEVATLFINYFRNWPKRKENISQLKDLQARQRALKELERLDPLVYTINDMVEERGFESKFAALTVCLFNSANGVASICNAGDTVLNMYSVEKKSMVHSKLPGSPAAGMFPSMLVDMKTPYQQVQQRLASGDVLFMATDGFEDSEHRFRDADFQQIVCNEPGLAEKQHHTEHLGDHEKGLDLERFGVPREDELINAVLNKGRFVLVRNHNPIPDEEIVFDFSTCQGTAQEVVLAMVAVDRIYRMIPDPRLGDDDKVVIESKVVDFLREHFLQYTRYFSHPVEGGKDTGYVTFTHAMEDNQSDDLTILVLRRK